ncbi:hypothetical protein H4R99_006388, partial [Coemansia sp. RSA 1722]
TANNGSSGGATGRSEKPAATTGPSSSGARRFVAKDESVEARLKQSTVGLVQLSDFQRIKNELEEERRREAAQTLIGKRNAQTDHSDNKKKKPRGKKKNTKPKLSFDDEDEDEVDDDLVRVVGGVLTGMVQDIENKYGV